MSRNFLRFVITKFYFDSLSDTKLNTIMSKKEDYITCIRMIFLWILLSMLIFILYFL